MRGLIVAAAELWCAGCFTAVVISVVIVCIKSARRECELVTNAVWEPLPQRMPSPALVIATYAHLRCIQDGEATWMLHSGQFIYCTS